MSENKSDNTCTRCFIFFMVRSKYLNSSVKNGDLEGLGDEGGDDFKTSSQCLLQQLPFVLRDSETGVIQCSKSKGAIQK